MSELPTLDWESQLGYPKQLVAGVDEVGRGCLAGPVVAGAVILPSEINHELHPWVAEIQDSKMLKPEVREKLAPLIEGWAVASAIGVASVEEIDKLNIYHAAHLAMRRALEGLKHAPQKILIDGNAIPKGLRAPATAVVKGDLKCLSIAAASVIAKVWRDRWMAEIEAQHPGYGFGVHKGYATPAHMKALEALRPCAIHRRSFAPIAAFYADSKPDSSSGEQTSFF